MANTISTELKRDTFLNTFLEAFVEGMMAVSIFSRDFSPESLAALLGNVVKVPYVPAASSAEDFAGTYTVQGTTWSYKDVTIDKHKFVSVGLTDTEVANTPLATIEMQAKMKAHALAKTVVQDILSLVTAANFGSAGVTSVAANFDTDDVADLMGLLDAANVPEDMRSLVVGPTYYTNLIKDNKDSAAFGGSEARRQGFIPNLAGADVLKSNIIPDNSENLVGFSCYPSAIALGMRYLQPQEGADYYDARPVTDPDTGITLGFRDWYDKDTGTRKQVLECNYGYKLLEAAALDRVVSS